jgi:hypothetical protein
MDKLKKDRFLDVKVEVDIMPIALMIGLIGLMYVSRRNK